MSCVYSEERGNQDVAVQPLKLEVPLTSEGLHDSQSEYNDSFRRYSVESLTRPSKPLQIMDDGLFASESAAVANPQIPRSKRRSRFSKNPTTLKLEGDFLHVTEYAEKFIQYLIEKRAELLRTPTTLKLEGDMENKTENRDRYIKYDQSERPPLCKGFSNLHLEGEHDNTTEKREKFVPFDVYKRPPLTKKSTNLHMEGDLNLIPEYTRQYVEHKSLERQKITKPANHLKLAGLFEDDTIIETNQFHKKNAPTDTILARNRKDEGNNYWSVNKSSSHPNLHYPRSNIPLEGIMDLNPEYKSSYVDFYKEGKLSPRVRNRRPSELRYMKEGNNINVKAEYSSSYVDFPRQRPHLRKPENQLSSEGGEKNERYVPHTNVKKTKSCRRESELKLEGPFECQPEYRKAYIDYLIREKNPDNQRRRAFELVSTNEESHDSPNENFRRVFAILRAELDLQRVEDDEDFQEKAVQSIILEFKENTFEGDQTVLNGKEAPNVRETEPLKSHLTVPGDVKNSSSPSSVTSSRLSTATKPPPSTRKLSQIEESAFGPKCQQRKGRRTQTPSPLPRGGRNSRMGSRDISPKLVPDLAAMPQKPSNLSLGIGKEPCSERNMWIDSSKQDKAFLVLDDRVPSKKVAPNSLYKEQKWMPSWDYSRQ
ncbi:hypothetical protein NQ317_000129 [Molorchus minor]|uniref:Uncharacterized protein n=1 Tax=Molorchus minor TaxID=1323400 RepID=A0ABQ9JT26_9CUCU|nr:hypothetical protein NQ317_000129 [Molorchus minor]